MTRVVAFDEAGNTGEDLLNADQPVFSLASVGLPISTASALAVSQGSELHFRKARRSKSGRSAILHVLTDPALSRDTIRVVGLHKQFSVVAKMVDLLVEPLAARASYDLYSEGTHLALSNLLFGTLPVVLGKDPWTRVLKDFVAMCREPTKELRRSFIQTLEKTALNADERTAGHLKLLAAGTALGEFGESGIPDLDPAPPCLIALAHAWAADGAPFSILHDDRKELRRWEPYLAGYWQERKDPETFVLFNGRSITYPLPVKGLKMAASEADPRLQVADVVAGAAQMVLAAQIGVSPDPKFASTLREATSIMSWFVHGNVWPTLDVDPLSLGVQPGATPNLADAMTAWSIRENDS